jgi:sugar O-acyltransferase (sialic acid O-acetyltransferase NeuD family)
MIIVGARGFAKEVLEILYQLNEFENLVFYDDVNKDLPKLLYDQFPILKSKEQVSHFFKTIDSRFTIGVGNPFLRYKLMLQFQEIGGVFTSTISPSSKIGHFGTFIDIGNNVMDEALISNDVRIGKGGIVYFKSIISHDTFIDDFVEISPGATILGRCKIGSFSQIGSNATILPDVNIGKNVIVGAGSVVTKDIPDNSLVVGVPAMIKKNLPKLSFE